MTFCAAALMFTSCGLPGGEDDGDKEIRLTGGEKEQTVHADDTEPGSGISFTALSDWTADVSEKHSSRANDTSWLRLLLDGKETYSGGAGTFTLTIEIDPNYSGKTRSATITIICGEDKISVTVTQNGTGEDGKVPEAPRLITAITQSGTFNSDQYDDDPFEPMSYEFKYFADNLRLKELRIIDPDWEYGNYVYTYDYTTLNEIRVTDNWGELYTAPLNSMGYVSRVTEEDMPDDFTLLTYDSNGYLKTTGVGDGRDGYTYIWRDGNLVGVEDEEAEVFYTKELNDKTNIDLNAFLMYVVEGNMSYNPEGLFMLIDRMGKRSRNYIVFGGGDADDYPAWPDIPYSEANLPAIGTVWATRYEDERSGDPFWSFDAEGWPVSYTWKESVVKVEWVYNGDRRPATPRDEYEKERWINDFGPGPWYFISFTTKTYPAVIDTYKYNISYNR